MIHMFMKESAKSIVWLSTMIYDLFGIVRNKIIELANED